MALSLSRQELQDDSLPDASYMVFNFGPQGPESLDISFNLVTSAGLTRFLKPAWRFFQLKFIDVGNNRVCDDGASILSQLCRECPGLSEMHLTHNRITDNGAAELVPAACDIGRRTATLLLRLDLNQIAQPLGLLRGWATEGLSICTQQHCKQDMLLHMPFFTSQRAGITQLQSEARSFQPRNTEHEDPDDDQTRDTEHKKDPDDDQIITFRELKSKYASLYSEEEIEVYWNINCERVSRSGPQTNWRSRSSVPARSPPPRSGTPGDTRQAAMAMPSSPRVKLSPQSVKAKARCRGLNGVRAHPDDGDAAVRKMDPADWEDCTFPELLRKYEGVYSRAELKAYWDFDCGRNADPSRWGPPLTLLKKAVRKVDPADGFERTYMEMRRKYAGRYSDAELQAYWDFECSPVRSARTWSEPVARQGNVDDRQFIQKESVLRKVDPYDGQVCTFSQLRMKCAGAYSERELQVYWDSACKHVGR